MLAREQLQNVRKKVRRKPVAKNIYGIISSLVVKSNIIMHKASWKGIFVSSFT